MADGRCGGHLSGGVSENNLERHTHYCLALSLIGNNSLNVLLEQRVISRQGFLHSRVWIFRNKTDLSRTRRKDSKRETSCSFGDSRRKREVPIKRAGSYKWLRKRHHPHASYTRERKIRLTSPQSGHLCPGKQEDLRVFY